MKKFMMIFIGTNYSDLGLSPEEMQERMGSWMTWNDKMAKAGIMETGYALHPQAKEVTGSDRTVSDRTATELKELIGGYYIVKANTYEDVVEIAQDYPDYDLGGTVQIREVVVF